MPPKPLHVKLQPKRRQTVAPGLTWENCGGAIAQRAPRMGWALCVGAGSSCGTKNGVFPDWAALVDELIRSDDSEDGQELSKSLQEHFAPDALIQAAKNRRGLSPRQFIALLKDLVYE